MDHFHQNTRKITNRPTQGTSFTIFFLRLSWINSILTSHTEVVFTHLPSYGTSLLSWPKPYAVLLRWRHDVNFRSFFCFVFLFFWRWGTVVLAFFISMGSRLTGMSISVRTEISWGMTSSEQFWEILDGVFLKLRRFFKELIEPPYSK